MANFLAELKRRHIYRIGAAYVLVAWVLLQVVNNVAPALNLPNWALSLVLVLLAVGFPIALIFAWAFDLKAAPASVDGQGSSPAARLKSAHTRDALPAARSPQTARTSVVSIAVLPFANMSSEASQEFFSDGITEEVTAALVKVADLRVVARTSAFEFKGKNHNIRSIGEALGASHLIEGSVRKAGDRLRITAQLIKAEDGTHLWAERYDRDVTDIFAVQEDIAQAIAGALRLPLGLKAGETLVPSRTVDFDSYQQYLRARALVRARGTSINDAIAILEPMVQRDPNFAPAWALLAHAYYLQPTFNPTARTRAVEEGRRHVLGFFKKCEEAGRRSIMLDSRNAVAYGALGALNTQRGKWAQAEDLFRKALAIDPGEPDALLQYSILLAVTRRLKETLNAGGVLRTLEPLVHTYTITHAGHLFMSGQVQAAIAMLEAIPLDAGGGYFRSITLAAAYASQGRYTEASDTLLLMPEPNVVSRKAVEDAARLIRMAPGNVDLSKETVVLEGGLNFVYAYIGADERIMRFPERVREVTDGGTTTFIWSPAYASIRKTERFKSYVRAVGLVDYWRTRGWPDGCRPLGDNDFVCD